ncbi:MAG: hypothetical protein HKN68_17590 [Saprospiraceae bacterium]|nr:hypothetical protein [Saprospiraceae bacterium]
MTFTEFLSFFPEVDLPVTLSEETIDVFSRNNKVLPLEAIDAFIGQWEEIDGDTTEYIPCIQLPQQDDYIGIIYWRGAILQYDYFLVTLDKNGQLISRKSIASTKIDGEIIKRSVASIDNDLIINIIAGASQSEQDYDPDQSQAFSMEVMPTGDILFTFGDEGN